jgi:REP element-mobilizing transposase RayT
VNRKIVLNDAGEMIKKWYMELENIYPGIQCGEMITMPNHIHFIINIVNTKNPSAGTDLRVSPFPNEMEQYMGEHTGSPLHCVIQWFKTMTTNEYIRGVKSFNWERFCKRLWQRNYYEHIIRDDNEYDRIVWYIRRNPEKWNDDRLNDKTKNLLMEPIAEYGSEPWMI